MQSLLRKRAYFEKLIGEGKMHKEVQKMILNGNQNKIMEHYHLSGLQNKQKGSNAEFKPQ